MLLEYEGETHYVYSGLRISFLSILLAFEPSCLHFFLEFWNSDWEGNVYVCKNQTIQ